jgi:hypothetical protein
MAAVPDNITPQVLKELATHIVPILTIIFLCSYQTSEVPDDFYETLQDCYTSYVDVHAIPPF